MQKVWFFLLLFSHECDVRYYVINYDDDDDWWLPASVYSFNLIITQNY